MLGKKGVTLVELLVTIAISSVIFFLAFSFYFFGSNTFSKGEKQVDIQSDVRLVADFITDNVRNATSVEISSLSDPFDDQFNYIFLDSGRIVFREAGTSTDVQKTNQIIDVPDDFSIEIRKLDNDYLVYFNIIAKNAEQSYSLETEVYLSNIRIADIGIGKAFKYKK